MRPSRTVVATAGGVFLAADLVRTPVLGQVPLPNASAAGALAFYAGNGGRVLASALLLGIALAAALVFFAGLRRAFTPAPSDDHAPVWFTALVIVIAIDLVRMATLGVLGLRAADLGPQVTLAMHLFGTVLGASIAFPASVAFASLAAATRGDPTVPRWIPSACLALAPLWLASAARLTTTATWVWAFGSSAFVVFALFAAALVVTVARGGLALER